MNVNRIGFFGLICWLAVCSTADLSVIYLKLAFTVSADNFLDPS